MGTLESFFGNTVVVRMPDGKEAQYHYAADGSYTMTAGGSTTNGAWANTDEGLRLTPASGPPRSFKLPEGKQVGDTWTVPGPNGEFTLRIVAGK
jgi:hypothetical protein